MVFFKYREFVSNIIAKGTFNPSRIYAFKIVNGVVYGFDNKPYDYAYRDTSSNGRFWGELSNTDDSNTRVQIGFYGNVQLWESNVVYYGVDENSQLYSKLINGGYSSEPSTSLTGKYRIKKGKLVNMNINVNPLRYDVYMPIIMTFSINGVLYKGIRFYHYVSRSTFRFEGDQIDLIRYDDTIETYATLTDFGEAFDGSVIEFAGDPIPEPVGNWFLSVLDIVYEGAVSVFDGNGNELATINELPPIVSANVYRLENLKRLTLIDVNDNTHTIEWISTPPSGTIFTGLSFENNAPTADIKIGDNTVDWYGNIVLYEVFTLYDEIITPIDICLYNNTAEPNRVDKTDYLSEVMVLNGVLRDECSVISPVIIFEASAFIQFNYVYIPAFARYYYVIGIDSVCKGLWRMRLTCDVLMSYKEKIWTLDAVIDRQENDFNPMLNDPNVPAQTDRGIEVIEMDSLDTIGGGTFDVQDTPDFTRRCDYVLLTVGEGESTE